MGSAPDTDLRSHYLRDINRVIVRADRGHGASGSRSAAAAAAVLRLEACLCRATAALEGKVKVPRLVPPTLEQIKSFEPGSSSIVTASASIRSRRRTPTP